MDEPIVVTRVVERSDSSVDEGRDNLVASPWHTAFVLAVVGINAYRGITRAAQAGFSPSRPTMYLRTILFELVVLAIVLLGVKLRGVSLQSVLGKRWKSFGQVFLDLGLGIALLFLSTLVSAIFGGHQNSSAANQSIQFLLPQTAVEMAMWMVLSITAGICEEAVYRGYLQRQFGALTRNAWVGILFSAAVFGGVHLYQGARRAAVIAVSAILFGAFAKWRKTVRPGMFAHALQDGIAPLLMRLMRP